MNQEGEKNFSYIRFSRKSPPLKNGILVCVNEGKTIELTDTGGRLKEQAELEYYNGIVVPGFINAHCHPELSYLKGKILPKSVIGQFIGAINKLRNREKVLAAIRKTGKQLFTEGVGAVGDISNSILSLKTKRESKVYYYTCAEAFGFAGIYRRYISLVK